MGQMAGILQPYLATFGNQMNQQSFNQQLGRGASNQMYQPPSNPFASDPYTAARRPNYMPFGPNQQFYQPIYRPSYDQQVRTMDQMPQPMMPQPMLSPQPMQQQYAPAPMQQTQPRGSGDAFADLAIPMLRRSSFGSRRPAPSNFQYSVNYGEPMLSPQPMQSQYRPIPYMTQTQVDARTAADAAAAAPPPSFDGGGAKAGGKVHEEGIDSLLKK